VKTNKMLFLDLNQHQTNMLLRGLESLENDAKGKEAKEAAYKLWNKIFDAGLSVGFGQKTKPMTDTQSYDLWDFPEKD
jgi:hypothetical protein